MKRIESKAEERFKDVVILFFILLVEWIYLMID
jgi:hypothetical protein